MCCAAVPANVRERDTHNLAGADLALDLGND
jgi:hypothetical protein